MGNTTHTLFINTKKEAKIAAQIAKDNGWENLSADMFYKRYLINVFAPWSTWNEIRDIKTKIVDAIRFNRALVSNARGDNMTTIASKAGVAYKANDNFEDILNKI